MERSEEVVSGAPEVEDPSPLRPAAEAQEKLAEAMKSEGSLLKKLERERALCQTAPDLIVQLMQKYGQVVRAFEAQLGNVSDLLRTTGRKPQSERAQLEGIPMGMPENPNRYDDLSDSGLSPRRVSSRRAKLNPDVSMVGGSHRSGSEDFWNIDPKESNMLKGIADLLDPSGTADRSPTGLSNAMALYQKALDTYHNQENQGFGVGIKKELAGAPLPIDDDRFPWFHRFEEMASEQLFATDEGRVVVPPMSEVGATIKNKILAMILELTYYVNEQDPQVSLSLPATILSLWVRIILNLTRYMENAPSLLLTLEPSKNSILGMADMGGRYKLINVYDWTELSREFAALIDASGTSKKRAPLDATAYLKGDDMSIGREEGDAIYTSMRSDWGHFKNSVLDSIQDRDYQATVLYEASQNIRTGQPVLPAIESTVTGFSFQDSHIIEEEAVALQEQESIKQAAEDSLRSHKEKLVSATDRKARLEIENDIADDLKDIVTAKNNMMKSWTDQIVQRAESDRLREQLKRDNVFFKRLVDIDNPLNASIGDTMPIDRLPPSLLDILDVKSNVALVPLRSALISTLAAAAAEKVSEKINKGVASTLDSANYALTLPIRALIHCANGFLSQNDDKESVVNKDKAKIASNEAIRIMNEWFISAENKAQYDVLTAPNKRQELAANFDTSVFGPDVGLRASSDVPDVEPLSSMSSGPGSDYPPRDGEESDSLSPRSRVGTSSLRSMAAHELDSGLPVEGTQLEIFTRMTQRQRVIEASIELSNQGGTLGTLVQGTYSLMRDASPTGEATGKDYGLADLDYAVVMYYIMTTFGSGDDTTVRSKAEPALMSALRSAQTAVARLESPTPVRLPRSLVNTMIVMTQAIAAAAEMKERPVAADMDDNGMWQGTVQGLKGILDSFIRCLRRLLNPELLLSKGLTIVSSLKLRFCQTMISVAQAVSQRAGEASQSTMETVDSWTGEESKLRELCAAICGFFTELPTNIKGTLANCFLKLTGSTTEEVQAAAQGMFDDGVRKGEALARKLAGDIKGWWEHAGGPEFAEKVRTRFMDVLTKGAAEFKELRSKGGAEFKKLRSKGAAGAKFVFELVVAAADVGGMIVTMAVAMPFVAVYLGTTKLVAYLNKRIGKPLIGLAGGVKDMGKDIYGVGKHVIDGVVDIWNMLPAILDPLEQRLGVKARLADFAVMLAPPSVETITQWSNDLLTGTGTRIEAVRKKVAAQYIAIREQVSVYVRTTYYASGLAESRTIRQLMPLWAINWSVGYFAWWSRSSLVQSLAKLSLPKGERDSLTDGGEDAKAVQKKVDRKAAQLGMGVGIAFGAIALGALIATVRTKFKRRNRKLKKIARQKKTRSGLRARINSRSPRRRIGRSRRSPVPHVA